MEWYLIENSVVHTLLSFMCFALQCKKKHPLFSKKNTDFYAQKVGKQNKIGLKIKSIVKQTLLPVVAVIYSITHGK